MSTTKDSTNMADQSVQPESNAGVLVEDKSQESMATTSDGTKTAEGSEPKAEREAKLSDLLVSAHSGRTATQGVQNGSSH
jgi:hypothetical protein